MNITGSNVVASMAVPLLLAGLLIWSAKRSRLLLPLASIFVLGGIGSLLLALGLSRLLDPVEAWLAGAPGSVRWGLVHAFLAAAVPEELARLATTVGAMAAWRRAVGREAIVTCAMVGLGFALFENVLYSLVESSGAAVLIGRAVPTLSHGVAALIMGSLLDRAVSSGPRFWSWRIGIALAVPVLLHGLYDFGAFQVEVIEFPELPDDPNAADLQLVLAPLATMFLVSSIALLELVWGGRILFGLRKAAVSNGSTS